MPRQSPNRVDVRSNTTLETDLINEAWRGLAADASGAAPAAPAVVELTGDPGGLPSQLAAGETAVACVATALLAAAGFHAQRGADRVRIGLDRGHVAAAFRSERYFRKGGRPAPAGFAPLSRFWKTADGWVRTHANYPWHRDALLRTLSTTDEPAAVAAAISKLPSEEIERRVDAAGGVAAAVRRLDAWRAHPQCRALAAEPLIHHAVFGDAAPRKRSPSTLPAAGIRVLDLTRVIAGPACTRFLAALGADVLRVDPPTHPDMNHGLVADSLLGKRSSLVDLTSSDGASVLHKLLEQADVVVSGYRPGALDRFGLGADALAELHPGVVVAYIDAWGYSGPWADRRGFDSIVQAATGIATLESGGGAEPGALPCQLLDHGTGYLAAAAVLDGLRRQSRQGGTHVRRLSLARTAWWLTSITHRPAMPAEAADADPATWLVDLDSAEGTVAAVGPPGTIQQQPLRWNSPVTGYGNDLPGWSIP